MSSLSFSLLGICEKGGTSYSLLEAKEILGIEGEAINDFLITFEVEKIEDACKLIYLNQSFQRIFLVLDNGNFSSFDTLLAALDKISFDKIKSYLEKISSISIETYRHGYHNFNSLDVEKEVIKLINKKIGKKIDLKTADLVISIIIDHNKYYIGIDLAAKDLSKREYRVFIANDALKGTVAYDFVRFTLGTDKSKDIKILDPFPRSGEIILETAFYLSGISVNYFKKNTFSFIKYIDFDFEIIDKKAIKEKLNLYAIDKDFRYISMIKKNAKIGGIENIINYSRQDLEYIHLKFKDKEINYIITYFPYVSKYENVEKYRRMSKIFFEQCDRLIKKNGRIGIITKQPELIESQSTIFEIEEKKQIWQGKTVFSMLRLKRKREL